MWQRIEIGTSDEACGLCRSDDVVIVRCTEVRTGWARLDPRWQPRVRTYRRCRSCKAKQAEVSELQPA